MNQMSENWQYFNISPVLDELFWKDWLDDYYGDGIGSSEEGGKDGGGGNVVVEKSFASKSE